MKKKILLFVAIMATFMCLFAISSSAANATNENPLGKYDSDPGVDSVTHRVTADESIDLSNYFTRTGSKNNVITDDTTAKSVLYDAVTNGYYVFPSIYLTQDMTKFEYYVSDLNTAIAAYATANGIETYPQFSMYGSWGNRAINEVVHYQMPNGVTKLDGSHCLLKNNANMKTVWVASTITSTGTHIFASNPKLEYVYNFENTNLSDGVTFNNFFENSYSMKEIKLPNITASIGNLGQIWGKDANGQSYTSLAQNRTFRIYIPNENYTLDSSFYKESGNTGKFEFVYCGDNYEEFLAKNTVLADVTVVKSSEYTLGSFTNKYNFVCDYSLCDGYYNGVHEETDTDCATEDTCNRCNKVSCPTHKPNVVITYEKYTSNGSKVITCEYDNCNGKGTIELNPLFTTKGYSIKESSSKYGILTTYEVDVDALQEYEVYLAEKGKTFELGIFVANADFGTNETFMTNGKLNTEYGLQLEITARDYFRINCTVTEFTANEADLELVMSLYVIEDGKVSYIQHEGTYAGEVSKTDGILDKVTIRLIDELDTSINVPEVIIPKKDEE